MKNFLLIASLASSTLFALSLCVAQEKKEAEWVSIFDGKTMKGWHVSSKTGHSRPSKNQTGGKWEIVDGAIIGCQDIPGNGGIIITDEKYSDFEVSIEMKNDFGPDSGLFLRSTEDGKCYQAMIDYHANGNLMGVYGEGLGVTSASKNWSRISRKMQPLLNCLFLQTNGQHSGSMANGMNSKPALLAIPLKLPLTSRALSSWNIPIRKNGFLIRVVLHFKYTAVAISPRNLYAIETSRFVS